MRHRHSNLMMPLPWKHGGASGHDRAELVASVTRLRLRRWRDVPGLVLASLRLRRQFPSVEGAVGLGLAAQPLQRTFWTLTLWRDDASVRAYMTSAEHAAVMRRYRPLLLDARSARWTVAGRERPRWREATQRIDRNTFGSAAQDVTVEGR